MFQSFSVSITPYRYLSAREEGVDDDGSSSFDPEGSSSSLLLEMSSSKSFESSSKDMHRGDSSMTPTNLFSPSVVVAGSKSTLGRSTTTISLANLLFFVGACCQTITTVWDWTSDKTATDNGTYIEYYYDDDNGDNAGGNDDVYGYIYNNDDATKAAAAATTTTTTTTPSPAAVYLASDQLHYFLFTLGPVLYLGVALLQMRRSMQKMSTYCNCASSSGHSGSSSPWLGLMAAMIFGMAAMCEIYSTILDDVFQTEDSWIDDAYHSQLAANRPWFASNYKMTMIAMHLYLVSGMMYFESLRRPQQSLLSTTPVDTSIMKITYIRLSGTLLFMVGTLMDCLLTYIDDPQTLHGADVSHNYLFLDKFNAISSILWNVAAGMFVLADIVRHFNNAKMTT